MAGVVSAPYVELAAETDPAVDNADIASADESPAPAEDTDVPAQPETGDKPTGDSAASYKALEDVIALSPQATGDSAASDKAIEDVIAQPPQATGASTSKAPVPVKAKAADRPMTKSGDKPTPK